MSRLLKEYREKIRPLLMKELGFKNIMRVPRIEKIVVNVGLGEAVQDPKLIEVVSEDLARIT